VHHDTEVHDRLCGRRKVLLSVDVLPEVEKGEVDHDRAEVLDDEYRHPVDLRTQVTVVHSEPAVLGKILEQLVLLDDMILWSLLVLNGEPNAIELETGSALDLGKQSERYRVVLQIYLVANLLR